MGGQDVKQERNLAIHSHVRRVEAPKFFPFVETISQIFLVDGGVIHERRFSTKVSEEIPTLVVLEESLPRPNSVSFVIGEAVAALEQGLRYHPRQEVEQILREFPDVTPSDGNTNEIFFLNGVGALQGVGEDVRPLPVLDSAVI